MIVDVDCDIELLVDVAVSKEVAVNVAVDVEVAAVVVEEDFGGEGGINVEVVVVST